jgi:hypothetical protein
MPVFPRLARGVFGKNAILLRAKQLYSPQLNAYASMAGAGFLARAEQDASVEWEKIKKVKVRKGIRYIFVRGGFGNKPIGLYCNKENFEPVLALIQSKFKR